MGALSMCETKDERCHLWPGLSACWFGVWLLLVCVPGDLKGTSLAYELEVEKFITHEVGFSEINKAFDLMLKGESLRCIIRMDA
ncbi:alcohol dehydrogenase superfamily, zinc-type, GroES-like protein [Artemisia annua]|uniref:Alcohol dehydrogenase superfamily, zinc-type, GroES-like protein n=1 Tax=Artemisia annua TaxID=35608 RepID=A0A2U1KWC3_ARTAN|nr:alcohol dehydrogenase superfamily, zinc-type, GroES-like protein [Artemisia annua]